MTYEYLTWTPVPEEEPTSYYAVHQGYGLQVDQDVEFNAWTWIVKDLETEGLLDSGMARYDTEAIKAAERAVRYKLLGVKYHGLY